MKILITMSVVLFTTSAMAHSSDADGDSEAPEECRAAEERDARAVLEGRTANEGG